MHNPNATHTEPQKELSRNPPRNLRTPGGDRRSPAGSHAWATHAHYHATYCFYFVSFLRLSSDYDGPLARKVYVLLHRWKLPKIRGLTNLDKGRHSRWREYVHCRPILGVPITRIYLGLFWAPVFMKTTRLRKRPAKIPT